MAGDEEGWHVLLLLASMNVVLAGRGCVFVCVREVMVELELELKLADLVLAHPRLARGTWKDI
jgi:hypothetical protein